MFGMNNMKISNRIVVLTSLLLLPLSSISETGIPQEVKQHILTFTESFSSGDIEKIEHISHPKSRMCQRINKELSSLEGDYRIVCTYISSEQIGCKQDSLIMMVTDKVKITDLSMLSANSSTSIRETIHIFRKKNEKWLYLDIVLFDMRPALN